MKRSSQVTVKQPITTVQDNHLNPAVMPAYIAGIHEEPCRL